MSFILFPNLEKVPTRNVETFVTLFTCPLSFSSPEVASTSLSLSYSGILSSDSSKSSSLSFNSSIADCSSVFLPWFKEIGVSYSKYWFSGRVPALAIVVSCRQLRCRTIAPLTDAYSHISHFWSAFSVLMEMFFILFENCNDSKETAESGNGYHCSQLVK